MIKGQNIIDQIQIDLEVILYDLFCFWEDITILPHKFYKNIYSANAVTLKIMKLRSKVEELMQIHQDEKIFKIFILFMKLIGFPTAGLKKSLSKIQLKYTDQLAVKTCESTFKSFDINDKKVALLIADLSKDGNGTIAYASHTIKEVINIDASDLKDRNIKNIMPECYQKIHPSMVSGYFASHHKNKNKSSSLIYTLDKNKVMSLTLAYIKAYPFVHHNIRLVR